MKPIVLRSLYRTGMFILSIALVAAMWELYKFIGPQNGGKLFGGKILPRANDRAMPHVWDMLSRYGRQEVRGSDRKIWSVVLAGGWFSFRLVLAGFVLGAAIGVGLAVLMARFRIVERGLLPYLVLSQTVPLIALAPLVVSWGGKLHMGGFEWPTVVVGVDTWSVFGILPRLGWHAQGVDVGPCGGTRVDEQLRILMAANFAQTPISSRSTIHGSSL